MSDEGDPGPDPFERWMRMVLTVFALLIAGMFMFGVTILDADTAPPTVRLTWGLAYAATAIFILRSSK